MGNVIKHPSAPAKARKTERNGQRGAKAANAEDQWSRQRYDDAEERVLRALNEAAWAVHVKAHKAGVTSEDMPAMEAAAMDIVALGAEAAAAKAVGYESWAAFEEARALAELA